MNRRRNRNRIGLLCLSAILVWALAGLVSGLEPKESTSYLSTKEFFRPDLSLDVTHEPLASVLESMPNQAAWERHQVATKAAGRTPIVAYVDARSGTTTSMILSLPVLPGQGVGNRITLEELRQGLGLFKMGAGNSDDEGVTAAEVVAAMRQVVSDRRDLLGIDFTQVGEGLAGRANRDLWHFAFPQTFQGVWVRYGRIVGAISHGNVVLLGAETWGNPRGTSTNPKITADEALEAGFAYLGGRSSLDEVGPPRLEIVPVMTSNSGFGQGFRHVLTWTFNFIRMGENETWEVTVAAADGEVLSVVDLNQYLEGQTEGGVYPITSTEICPTNGTCGVMQLNTPMPFADTGLAAPNNFTNSAGLVNSTANVTTTLSGQFVNINDNCGAISVSGTTGTIVMGGVNGDHDCTVGSGGSAGNTPASRTGFYELNKLIEIAQGWLPSNTWIRNQLTANMNIGLTCNAFWNGATINFYRSGGGCLNTGELAGVFDHEWGHGLDDNDTLGSLSNTSEGYADIAGIYRLHDSCVGHGFNVGAAGSCGLTSDGTGPNRNENQVGGSHCDTDCSGVRDADWGRHADNTPDTPLNFVCSDCLSGSGPCGAQTHCSAAPIRQAAWDLVTRDLPLDRQTNFVIGNKLFYQGSGAINTWYSCTCGSSSSGCGSGSGYLQWLAADDDNGNLNDGTPHMQAIFDAFNRHGIACATPTPQNGGCAGGPTTAPTLNVTAGANAANLSWTNVANASEYWVFRTEGHAGCDLGKALIAEVGGTAFTDTEVAGDREYWYSVMAAGTSDACFTTLSNCANVTPVAPAANAPDVVITAPANDSTFDEGTAINFTGTAVDPQEGDLSASISWTSSIDGAFGTGASVVISTLSLGTHTITASVTDSDSFTGLDEIVISILPACGTEVYVTTFESDDGGWVGGASTCTTGTFIRGTPDFVSDGGVTTQPAGASGGTFAWFTQNNTGGVGTDDVDGGTCETLSPLIAVGAGSSVVAFIDYYHGQRDANDDPADGFSIELIDADTNAVLDTLVVFGDVANNAVWTGIFGNVASSPVNVRLRVRATDAAGPGDLVEGGIDNVRICTGGGCTVDADCDNGLFCDGAETCNAGSCQPGTPPSCGDGVSCTDDSCNEATDSCDNVANDANCDNGLFCDGAETCDAVLDCQAGTAPNCDDGVGCTDDACNEGTDSCDNVTNDANCDDGAFCNGAETCDAALDCQAGGDPCPGQSCDEVGDVCVGCISDAECDDGLFCNGAETCNAGTCQAGTAVNCDDGVGCTDDACNEGTDSCDNVANDANCDNGLFCDGAETCDAVNDCQAGTAVNCDDGVGCTADACNEGTDSCDNVADDVACDNGLFCDGTETCDPVLDCQAGGGDPCTPFVCDEANDACVCVPKGGSCSSDAECCSGKCKGKAGSQTCK